MTRFGCTRRKSGYSRSARERRRELLAQMEACRLEEQKKRFATIEASKAKVREKVMAIASRLRVAMAIEAMVATLQEHLEVRSSKFEA